MHHTISDKAHASVLVIEPASTVRMMILGVLRSLGYTQLQGVASCEDAVSVLEVAPVDWIISPVLANDAVNALHLLKLITTEPKLRKTAFTLSVESNADSFCLSLAFELGLFSWQQKSYVKDNLQTDFEDLFVNFANNQNDVTLTAADYLRKHLKLQHAYKSLLSLEQNLSSIYPASATLLTHLAEAEFLNDNKIRGAGLLKQAELLDEKLNPVCHLIREKYFDKNEIVDVTNAENVLGLRNVVIIDPDTDVLYAATELLKELGVNSIECFEDGKNAIDWLLTSKKEPDLILMEWRIPAIAGPMLVQRIRQAEYLTVPIVVISSLIKRDERPLLVEMGVDEVLEKPFDKNAFYGAIVWTLQQNRLPTEQKSLERKIRRLLERRQMQEAERLLAHLLADDRMSEAAKLVMKAEYSFANEDYVATCEFGIQALRLGGDGLGILNLVGKALLKMRQYENALKCLEKANELCSINIERLLNISEINTQLHNKNKAERALLSASHLDPTNPKVEESEFKWEMEFGSVDEAKKNIDKLDSVQKIASFINNRAVALVRSGRFEESINLYERAIVCLSDQTPELVAAVRYNLGLAHARYGSYDKGLAVLNSIPSSSSLQLDRKISSMIRKIESAQTSGAPVFSSETDEFELESNHGTDEKSPAPKKSTSEFLDGLIATVTAKRGDLGCYLIFNALEEPDQKALDLLKDPPHFASRGAIERKETFGQ